MPTNNQLASVVRALRTFIDPDAAAVELRALGVRGDETHAGWFRGDQVEEMAAAALRLDPHARGVYFTPNPLRGPVNGEPFGVVRRRAAGETAKDADVSSRRWLLIDADPARIGEGGEILDSSLPATDAENEQAWRVIEHVRAMMEGTFGFLGPVVASSGNGWHLCYPVDMPNDEVAREMHRDLLRGLDKRCSSPEAAIDLRTFNAGRIWKVYATKSRKGTPSAGREHRWAGMLETEPTNPDHRPHNVERLRVMLKRWEQQDAHERREMDQLEGKPAAPAASAYAQKAFDAEVAAVQSAGVGNRNATLNNAAFQLGTFIGAGMLDRDAVEVSLTSAALGVGLGEAETRATIRSGIEAGVKTPRVVPEREQPAAKPAQKKEAPSGGSYAEPEEKKRPLPTTLDEVATIADLKRAGAKLRWLWKGWLQIGVVNIVAAQGGVGKTRLLLDLTRRIRHGLPWPDGQPMEVPADSLTLWVLSDNNHDEVTTASGAFGIEDAIRLNAHPDDPFGGVLISDAADLRELEARIALVKPVFVVIDTVGNATDLNLSKQEDAKAFYQPLQVIARRHSVAVICLTHLNAAGGTLGRRANEKVRSVINLSKPDPDQEDRRRLWVAKSNSQMPAPLGVTMGDAGNEYDTNPPVEPENGDGRERPAKKRASPKLEECKAWLREVLANGPRKVKDVRTMWELADFNTKTAYDAHRAIGATEYEQDGKKWWELNGTDDTSSDK